MVFKTINGKKVFISKREINLEERAKQLKQEQKFIGESEKPSIFPRQKERTFEDIIQESKEKGFVALSPNEIRTLDLFEKKFKREGKL